MNNLLLFGLLGLGSGSLIAVNGLALVLFHRASGTVNLATGSIAAFAGFVFYSLSNGYIFSPLPFGPAHISVGGPLGLLPAVVVSLTICIAGGVALDLVFRRLREASALAKIVASLGVLLLLGSIIQLRFGNGSLTAPTVLPSTGSVSVGGVPVSDDRLILVGVLALLTVLLQTLYRHTRFGIATRAAAENEMSATMAGLNPNRLSMVNTVVATTVLGLFGILVAPMTELNASAMTLAVVPALGAALLAGFRSFPVAAGVGLLLGMLGSIFTYLQTQSWFPTAGGVPYPGGPELLSFAIITIALIWRGNALPDRATASERRLPPAPAAQSVALRSTVLVIVGVAAMVVLPFGLRQALIFTLIGAIACLGLVVITGLVGQVALGQLAIAGVAGMLLSHLGEGLDVPFPLAPVLAVLLVTGVGVAMGAAALRVRGVNLAIVTLAGAVAIEQFAFGNSGWGGGTAAPVSEPRLLGLNLGFRGSFPGWNGQLPSPTFGILCVGGAASIGLLVCGLRRSTAGQLMLAVRSNERAAAAATINVTAVKLLAFGLSSAIAASAGVLYAYNFGAVDLDRFDLLSGLGIVALAYLGGITTVGGAFLGGLLAPAGVLSYLMVNYLHLPVDYQLIIYGLSVIVAMITTPEGAALHVGSWLGRLEARLVPRLPVVIR